MNMLGMEAVVVDGGGGGRGGGGGGGCGGLVEKQVEGGRLAGMEITVATARAGAHLLHRSGSNYVVSVRSS